MEKVIVYDASRYAGAARNWWSALTLGIIFLAFGALVFFQPGEQWLNLSAGFAIMVALSGILEIITGAATAPQAGRARFLAAGIIELMLGLIIIMMPDVLYLYLPFILGFWLMFRGYTMIGNSGDMAGYGIKGAGVTLAMAVLVMVCSFFMLAVPFINFGNYALWLGLALVFAAGTMFCYSSQLSIVRKELKK